MTGTALRSSSGKVASSVAPAALSTALVRCSHSRRSCTLTGEKRAKDGACQRNSDNKPVDETHRNSFGFPRGLVVYPDLNIQPIAASHGAGQKLDLRLIGHDV